MTDDAATPSSEIVRVRRVTWALLAPLAAAAVLTVLAVQAIRDRPVPITIRFTDGAGVRPGDPVICRGVQIGQIADVRLSPDARDVIVSADLARDAQAVAVEGTRFWVVRPEVSFRGVSGLDTLFGPKSIAVEPGPPDGPRRANFDGLSGTPPPIAPSDGSLVLTLRSSRRWSLGPGSPVSYRDVQVGQVIDYRLAADSTVVELIVTIEPRYAALVRDNSRFFSVAGITADWGIFSGLAVRAESLQSLLAGGIGLATPDRPGNPVADGHVFDLADRPDESWLRWTPSVPLGTD